jgi:ubiquinone/menaquinone biosynthesis C-methylase UbiE
MDRDAHNRKIADHFSGKTKHWRKIYDPSGRNAGYYYVHETVTKRKDAVVNFVEKCAGGKNLRILDAGCGIGTITNELARLNHVVYGVDPSAEMIEVAKKTLSEFAMAANNLRIGSVENLDFTDRSFDLCLCIGVLQYLQDDELALRELTRVTKPNGDVILTIPNIARIINFIDPYYYLRRAPFFLQRLIRKRGMNYTELSSTDIGKNLTFRDRRYFYGQLNPLFVRNRLVVRDIVPIGYGPITVWRRELFSKSFTLRAANFLENMASRKGLGFLKAFADRWVILLRKL